MNKKWIIIVEGTTMQVDIWYKLLKSVSFACRYEEKPQLFDSVEEASNVLFKIKNLMHLETLKVVEYDEEQQREWLISGGDE